MKTRFLLFVCFACLRLAAQHDTISPPPFSRYYIGASGQYGFLWTHRYNMGHLVKKHIGSFEIDVCKTTTGDKAWQQPYHYPWSGIALHYIPLGNPEQLGSAIGLYPYVNFPLGDRARNFKMNMRFGWGIGWLTKAFDPLENHKNVAIGSHLNTCLSLRLNGMWKISETNYMEFGIGMTHFSNGCMKLPNLGLNLPMISIGYFISATQSNTFEANLANDVAGRGVPQIREILADHHWHVHALLVTGMRDIDPPGGNRFGVLNALGSVMRQTSRKSRWGAGFDVMYSDAIRHTIDYDGGHVSVVENLQLGGKICYEWVLGRISFPVEIGFYLRTVYKENGPIYNRFAVHYLVGQHLLLNIDLKAHFAKAEYFEAGLGWRF